MHGKRTVTIDAATEMSVKIRKERTEDVNAIYRVVEEAFDSKLEAELVSLIRSREQSLLSFVATLGGQVIGHVLVSPITITSSSRGNFGGIAPLSVCPAHQGKGIGSALMFAAIEECRKLGLAALFLLGHPEYYPRFGFTVSHLGNEYGATDAFMQLELVPACLKSVRGKAMYVPAFGEIGT